MQLDEEIEKAFKAGAEWAFENTWCNRDEEIEMDRDINEGIQEYINGNRQSSEGSPILDKSHGGSI